MLASLVDERPPAGRVVVEDPFGAQQMAVNGTTTVLRTPVMIRPPTELGPSGGRPGSVTVVTDSGMLAAAERVIVDGFPHRHLQPWVAGQALPPLVLQSPGWRVWLAHRHGEPAAACYAYNDGASIGASWLATLPGHRSAGLGRAVMTAVLSAYPGRTTALVATEAGLSLYSALGFAQVGTATWYILR